MRELTPLHFSSTYFFQASHLLKNISSPTIKNQAFEIQVLITSAIKYWGYFRIFQFALAISRKETAKDSAETFVYYVSNGLNIPWYIALSF